MSTPARRFGWQRLHFTRPVAVSAAIELLRQWAGDPRSPRMVLEARGVAGGVTLLIGAEQATLSRLARTLAATVAGASLEPYDGDRAAIGAAAGLRLTTPTRPLRTQDPEATIQALLGALSAARGSEVVVVQVVLGVRRAARAVASTDPPSFSLPALTSRQRRDSEARTVLRAKLAEPGFGLACRLGVTAATLARRRSLMAGLLSALRTLEAPGVRLRLVGDRPHRLGRASSPWRWPLSLNVLELLPLLGWPLGDRDLPGVPGMHPKLLRPASRRPTPDERVVAQAATSPTVPLELGVREALHHLHVLGPTGTGKSTLLLNLLAQDVAAGHAVVLVEPTGDLVDALLARIPARRRDDVVLLDPADHAPLGLNPLGGMSSPELVADGLVATLRSLYAYSWGPRTQDILHACLLTLARRGDASILLAPLLLTNPGFRRSLTGRLAREDPVALGPFWAWYEALSDAERASVIAPVMNKLRPFLYNRSLRAVLGQTRPKIDFRTVLADSKILLVPLRKGRLGGEAARLLGSVVVATLWQAIQGRTALPPAQRTPVMVYVDELQDYLHLPTDLSDALAQARGLGVGFTLAHQYLAQLPLAMKAAVLGTVRSRVCFQLGHDDATVMARGHPELVAEDLSALGAFEVYASLFTEQRVTPYVSGRTLPATAAISRASEIRHASRMRYGQPLSAIESGLAGLLGSSTNDDPPSTGRRRRAS